jgi:hypothetical protein
MKRIFSALLLLTLGIGIGCGGDDDDGSDPGPIGGSDGAAGAPNDNVGCDPEGATACQNEQDCAFVIDGTARIEAGECGKGCIGQEESCARDCLLGVLEMTDECAGCYADTVNCSIMNCAAKCIADTEAQQCKDCQVEFGCREAFNTCSGLPE